MSKVRRDIFTADARFSVQQPEGKPTTLVGYAAVWNAISSDRGGYKVRLKPDSAQFAMPTLALRGHNFDDLLGTTKNGTLRIKSDATGVRVEIDLPDTSTGRDVAELVKRGDIAGMSFSMVNGPETYTTAKEAGETILDVTRFTIDEVTVTAIPAFRETSVSHKTDDSPAFHDAQLQRQRFAAFRLVP